MPRPKKENPKEHITATIDPSLIPRMKQYRDNPAHAIDGEKPSRSCMIELALDRFLPQKA